MIATTIDEVLAQLSTIIAEAERNNDRLGYFAALYYKVTLRVKEDIEKQLFEDGDRLAALDVLFANRYLDAFREWKRDKNSTTLSKSWRVAFESAGGSSYLVLQHLLLGMNAHINFDLGIAVAESARNGTPIDALRRDYSAINGILSALSHSVFNRLNIVSPFLSLLGLTGTKSNSMLVQFSLSNARDGAWCFATDLLAKDAADYHDFIAARDAEMHDLGTLLLESKGFLKVGLFLIRLFEWKRVDKVIQVFASEKLLYNQVKGAGAVAKTTVLR